MEEYGEYEAAYRRGYSRGAADEKYDQQIEDGGSAAIIVYGDSIEHFSGTDLHKFLIEEGFDSWIHAKGYPMNWVYVNLNSKVYAKGMPGINITPHLGNHAVTIDEFMTIYNIYKGKQKPVKYSDPRDAYDDGYSDGLTGQVYLNGNIGAGSGDISVDLRGIQNFNKTCLLADMKKWGFESRTRRTPAKLPWVNINLSRKDYEGGCRSWEHIVSLGQHLITIDEFRTIYDIFGKYEGLSVLEMESKE